MRKCFDVLINIFMTNLLIEDFVVVVFVLVRCQILFFCLLFFKISAPFRSYVVCLAWEENVFCATLKSSFLNKNKPKFSATMGSREYSSHRLCRVMYGEWNHARSKPLIEASMVYLGSFNVYRYWPLVKVCRACFFQHASIIARINRNFKCYHTPLLRVLLIQSTHVWHASTIPPLLFPPLF